MSPSLYDGRDTNLRPLRFVTHPDGRDPDPEKQPGVGGRELPGTDHYPSTSGQSTRKRSTGVVYTEIPTHDRVKGGKTPLMYNLRETRRPNKNQRVFDLETDLGLKVKDPKLNDHHKRD